MAALACVFVTASAYSASNTILVLGDSLSAEYGLARNSGWVALMAEHVKKENIATSIFNASVSGETTSGGRSRLPALLDQHRPSLVILELGANDGLRGLPIAATEQNLTAMISAAKRAKAEVLLVGMQIPPNYGRQYTEKFAAMYPKIAKEARVPLVPFLLEGIADKQQFFQPDRIHPTGNAQPIIFNNVWRHLKPLLAK
ncbi:MAG: tesA2 [Noviherbaspirillum sp.]|nr:tesA2 [Noviherbaspirillum sp.]